MAWDVGTVFLCNPMTIEGHFHFQNTFFLSIGNHGIICLEDVIHEVYSAGKYFNEVNNFLWPFCLSVARHAARNKMGFQKEMGNPGFRGNDINQLIRLLN